MIARDFSPKHMHTSLQPYLFQNVFGFFFIKIIREIISKNYLPTLSLPEIVTPVDPDLQITA